MPSTRQLSHSLRERHQKRTSMLSIPNLSKIGNFWMDSTNVSSVLAASPHAHLTGGIHRTTLDLLCSCRPTDGSLTQEMNTLMRD